jgi:hypothetical protein
MIQQKSHIRSTIRMAGGHRGLRVRLSSLSIRGAPDKPLPSE